MAPSTCSRSETPLSSSSSGASSASVGLSNLSYVAKDWKKNVGWKSYHIIFADCCTFKKSIPWIKMDLKKIINNLQTLQILRGRNVWRYIIYLLYRNQFLPFTIYHGPSWTQFVPTFRPWNFKGTRSLCSSDWSTSVETEISRRDSVGSPVGFSWRKSMVLFPSHLKKQ